jgi:DNA-directed RNA polymerase
VHQDGTCGGFQHYAALSSDAKSATRANILPSDFPQDIYTTVCNHVNRIIEEEAVQGVEEAIVLRGHITRKIVKQIVMTNIYDSTIISSRKQIVDNLCETPGIELDRMRHYTAYLARKVFSFLHQVPAGTRALRGWFYEAV